MWCTIASSSSSSVCVRARVLIIINHCAIVCHTRVQDSPVLVSSYPSKKVSEFPLPAPAKPAPLSPLFTIQQLPLCLRWCDHSLSRTNTSKRDACFGEWPSCSWKFSKFKFIVFVAFFLVGFIEEEKRIRCAPGESTRTFWKTLVPSAVADRSVCLFGASLTFWKIC